MVLDRDGLTQSPWQDIALEPLKKNTPNNEKVYDVIIVGAGITGITTGLLLQLAGKKCLIIESHNVGFGTTGGTTAHINTFFDATYPEIESDFSKEDARLVASAGKEAIEIIIKLSNKFKINCDLEEKDGYLYAQNEKQSKTLQQIFESSVNAGVQVTEADENGIPIDFEHSLKFSSQYQFHPLKYINGLLKSYLELGGEIIENTFVCDHNHNDGIHSVISEKHVFKGLNLVYATHIPPGINHFSFRCAPYRSYVLGCKLKNINDYPKAMAYDLYEPYHYIRTHNLNGEQILIVGGEDHKTGHEDPKQSFENLMNYATEYFDIDEVVYQWSSQYYVPVDGLPYIGRMTNAEDTVFVATGFNGNGMTWGTISGILISDLIIEKENVYEPLFKPYRLKPIAGLSEFIKENADVAYHFVAGKFKAERLENLRTLAREEGKVIEYNGQNVAVYKDEMGLIQCLNPICTHAGCTVNFNNAEKSWDCPCHGGRFNLQGEVISGPPRENLKRMDL